MPPILLPLASWRRVKSARGHAPSDLPGGSTLPTSSTSDSQSPKVQMPPLSAPFLTGTRGKGLSSSATAMHLPSSLQNGGDWGDPLPIRLRFWDRSFAQDDGDALSTGQSYPGP
jgi:hypothetical protein